MDLADAIIALIEKRLPGPALTLARPLFEVYVRALWLFTGATDAQFEKAMGGSFPLFKDIVVALGDDDKSGAAWIKNNKAVNWTSFNGLTHGGAEYFLRRIAEASIEPIYPDEELGRLLEFSLETAIRIGVEMYSVVEDADRMESLHAMVMRLRA